MQLTISNLIVGGTENVNYAVHVLMALLVQSEMLEEIFCNRLPPGSVSPHLPLIPPSLLTSDTSLSSPNLDTGTHTST